MLHAFRDGQASLLLCTPAASRGLDLPAVSHVYNMGLPEDATQYLHRAGRAGRIGSTSGGVVTTIVTPGQLASLQEMAAELGVELTEAEDAAAPPAETPGADGTEGGSVADVEKARKGLEDLFNLM